MTRSMSRVVVFVLLTGAFLLPAPALATNGAAAIASGSRAAGMGGADIAVATDATAMNTNPAGITQGGLRLDASVGLLIPSLTLSDRVTTPDGVMQLNDGLESEPALFPMINAGVSGEVYDGLHLGLGFFVQGGQGATFEDIGTFVDHDPMNAATAPPSPGTYGTESQQSFMKVTPTVAYRIALGDRSAFSVGAAGNIGLSQMSFTHSGFQFPESDGDGVYAAHTVDFESDTAVGFGGRFGVLLELLDSDLTFGVVYQTSTPLPYSGTTTIDDMIEYDTEIDFDWAQEVGFGVAGRPVDGLTLAADVRWINWSSTMDTVRLTGSATTEAPPGFEEQDMPFYMRWDDQVVLAFGVDYEIIDAVSVRAGYNFAKSPVSGGGINPLFPAVTEHHVTAGATFAPFDGFSANLAIEVVPENDVTSDADNQLAIDPSTGGPNGYETTVGMSQVTAHIGFGYAF